MRPPLASLPVLLAAGLLGFAAAPPPKPARADDQIDFVFLGSDRPTLIRLHVRVGDKPYGAPWDEFVDRLFAWFDKDTDGSLSPAEVARLPMPFDILNTGQQIFGATKQAVVFSTIDTNKDGKVSKEEFRAYYRNGGFPRVAFGSQNDQVTRANQINDAIVKRLDPKGDGKLTAAKVAGLYEKLRPLDENEDELITPAELNTRGGGGLNDMVVFTYGPPILAVVVDNSLQQIEPGQAGGLVGGLLRKYDRNKDGKLSREEVGLGQPAFARLDADGDGFLSPAELTAYLAAGEPDLVWRLQLGVETPGKGLLGRLNLGPLLRPRLLLVNDKSIDPALKTKYRRGPGDACAVGLGDTRLSLQLPGEAGNVMFRANNSKGYFVQLYTQAAGKKDHVTRADLKGSDYQNLLASFTQADKNADGKLTRLELVEWLDLLATASDTALTLNCHDLGRSLFGVLDADGDGRLSLREMRTAWKRLGPLAKGGAVGRDDVPRAMRLDIRFGGGQSFGTFAVAVPFGPNMAPRRPGRPGTPAWFRKMDRNDDADISPREWLGTDEEFAAADADGDGLISVEEAIAFEAKKKTKDEE